MLEVQCNASMGALPLDVAFTATQPWTILFGPSGSGKSSLLRLIAGLWQPQESRVMVDGNDLTATPPHIRHIALVAQQPALFPHMDVRHNIFFGMESQQADASKVAELLRRLQVPHVATQMPHELSGGEIKRVAIARALAAKPGLLLLDEVFTGMSASLAADLRLELRTWQKQTGTPILSVTHDIAEALEADEAIRIDKGKVLAQGSPRTVLSNERKALMLTLSHDGI